MKIYKAKTKIGDYEAGELVPEEKAIIWINMYKESPVEIVGSEAVKPVKEEKKSSKILNRIKEVTEDLLDDGKLNHSNNTAKKSPGRKKGKRK